MINVDIYIPALDEVKDFELDETVAISQILNEMREIFAKQEREELGRQTDDLLLCIPKEERILPPHLTIQMCGVKNGDRLMLV